MKTKLNSLVILTPGFPVDEADSTCVPPQQIFVKALKEANPEMNIIVLTFQYPFFSGEYQWHGIRVIAFGKEKQGRLSRILTCPRVWLTLRKLHRTHPLNGLLSFWFGQCASVASMFARQFGIPNYTWILGQDAKPGNKYFKSIRPAGGSLIALSDFIVSEFYKNYGVKPAHVIPVGIDPSLFNSTPVKRDIDILGAGSLIPLKQYDVFLEVISILKIVKPDIRAVICGDGPEIRFLRKMISNMNLENNVFLKGRMAHQEVLHLMQRSNIFLHTANYEGFGAVCLEALYAGARVVSFVRPMRAEILNWYIAENKTHMVKLIDEILRGPDPDHQPVLPYAIQDNVRKMTALFELT